MCKPDSPPKKRWRPPSKHRKARVGEADVFSWEAAAVLCFVAVAAALAFQHEGLRTRLAHLLWLPRDADDERRMRICARLMELSGRLQA